MQTKKQIQQLLASEGISPNKHLGQHFLIDLNLMRLLLTTADVSEHDTVLEVGCGTGSLTEELCKKATAVISVEIDARLATIAKNQLADKNNVHIINADILQNKNTINPDVTNAIKSLHKKSTGRFLLVANLPFNIASPLILNLIIEQPFAEAMYVTVQKEVAERMTAETGTKHYGTLSILLTATGNVKIERILPPTVFWPQPRVASATVSYVKNKEKTKKIKNMKLFTNIVKMFMQHRRKMLKSIVKLTKDELKEVQIWSQIFEICCIDAKQRPDQMTVENYIKIANQLS